MTPSGRGGPSAPGRFTNLQLRVMSALVLAVVVLGLAWWGGAPFRWMVAVIAVAMFYEWVLMTTGAGAGIARTASGVALGAVLIALGAGAAPWLVLAGLGLAAIVAFAAGRATGSGNWPAYGVIYAGLSGMALAWLRGADTAGLVAVLFLFAVVWMTDIAAYFVGRRLGGPKLAPSISPGKTWSGAIGGTIIGIVAGVALAAAAGLSGIALYAALALLVSIVSQIGDLFESAVKRRFGAKDSSTLIPGHGGVLDRVDGLVAGAFALYLIGAIISGQASPAAALFSP